jgi:hypothetical protein
MYMGKEWPELLTALTPTQQVQAAVLADMWQVTAASQAAVEILQKATNSAAKLSKVLEQLISLEPVPHILLPVLERALLAKYGDLEAVWGPGGASLLEPLLALPFHAMELLLASHKLKVRGWLQSSRGASATCRTNLIGGKTRQLLSFKHMLCCP